VWGSFPNKQQAVFRKENRLTANGLYEHLPCLPLVLLTVITIISKTQSHFLFGIAIQRYRCLLNINNKVQMDVINN